MPNFSNAKSPFEFIPQQTTLISLIAESPATEQQKIEAGLFVQNLYSTAKQQVLKTANHLVLDNSNWAKRAEPGTHEYGNQKDRAKKVDESQVLLAGEGELGKILDERTAKKLVAQLRTIMTQELAPSLYT